MADLEARCAALEEENIAVMQDANGMRAALQWIEERSAFLMGDSSLSLTHRADLRSFNEKAHNALDANELVKRQ